MINNITKPELSPNFTIGDIHKIREWHYEQLKDATIEETIAFYHEGSKDVLRMIDECRKASKKPVRHSIQVPL
jgi:hypothetical protein